MILSKECILLQNEIRKLSQQALLEKADELNKAGIMPVEGLGKLAEMGILGANAPEEFDGAALDVTGAAVAIEEISRVCASTALIAAVHNAGFIRPILKFGSGEQKQKYLSDAATGKIIGGYALISANEMKLQRTGEKFVVNGKNQFLLNGEADGPFMMYAPDRGTLSAFVIDADEKGVHRRRANVMGMNAAGIGTVVFENCSLSRNNIVGEEEQGRRILDEIDALAKIYFAAIALGLMQAAYDAALKYAGERVQFNEPIINFGMVREKIADIATCLEASRNLIYNAAQIADGQGNYRRAASIAKYYAGRSAVEITTQAIQIYGGYGYMKDYPVERYFRDAQVINVLDARPDVEKELIVKEILGA